ncbi:hypothetical protein SDC9_144660 [bioreactor metagenome]|uniref:Uncharacterized protein n=1 Tax=bioreactor metagenome TaxID=1076179 RepID=A0A645E6T0_9ZZZZ
MVIVKCGLLLGKRRCDDHRVLWCIREQNVAVKGAVPVKLVKMKTQSACAVFQRKGAGCTRNAFLDVAGVRTCGKTRLAKRQPEHRGNRLLRPVLKIQKRRGEHAHIGIVRNRQGNRILAVVNQIIVPFLDAGLAAANRVSVIGFHQGRGIPCLAERAGRVEKRAFGKKMLHGRLPPAVVFSDLRIIHWICFIIPRVSQARKKRGWRCIRIMRRLFSDSDYFTHHFECVIIPEWKILNQPTPKPNPAIRRTPLRTPG